MFNIWPGENFYGVGASPGTRTVQPLFLLHADKSIAWRIIWKR
jgi:hypothetical protein